MSETTLSREPGWHLPFPNANALSTTSRHRRKRSAMGISMKSPSACTGVAICQTILTMTPSSTGSKARSGHTRLTPGQASPTSAKSFARPPCRHEFSWKETMLPKRKIRVDMSGTRFTCCTLRIMTKRASSIRSAAGIWSSFESA